MPIVNCTVLFHYMDVGIKVPSGLTFLVFCNPTIKNISYLILSYHITNCILSALSGEIGMIRDLESRQEKNIDAFAKLGEKKKK